MCIRDSFKTYGNIPTERARLTAHGPKSRKRPSKSSARNLCAWLRSTCRTIGSCKRYISNKNWGFPGQRQMAPSPKKLFSPALNRVKAFRSTNLLVQEADVSLHHTLATLRMLSVVLQKKRMHYIEHFFLIYLEAAKEKYQQRNPTLATLHAENTNTLVIILLKIYHDTRK